MSDDAREFLLGSDQLAHFANARAVFTVDPELVRVRVYSPDGKTLLGDFGVSPARARTIGERFIAGANRLDPQGADKTAGSLALIPGAAP